ncbi:MAG: M56 family metallopeptidase [Gemmatimonadota bacterium]
MIAAWMLFSVVCGALVVLAGVLLEPVVAATGRPRRGLWTVVVMCTALVLLLPVVRTTPAVAADDARGNATPVAMAPVTEVAPSAVSLNDALRWAGGQWSTLQTRTGTWDTALVRAWMGIGAALLAFIVIGTRARTRESRALPALTQDALGNEVVLSAVGGPAATGVLRPRILLPQWTLDLDPTLRAIVLRHEAEHIAARDPALLLGAVLLLVLLPWHLPLWYAVHRLKIAIEVDCDARVLRAFPDVRRYARLLLLVSQQFRTSTPSFRSAHAGFTTLGSAHSNLRTRILVMTGSPARRFSLASLAQLAGALTVAAAVAAMPAPAVREAAAVPRGVDMPLVAGTVDAGDVAVFQQPPAPTKPPVPPQPPRVVPPARKMPAPPPEPPSVVMPPTPKRPATPPEPPTVVMPAPVPPAPPAFEKAPSLLRAKPPLYEVEQALPKQKQKQKQKENDGDATRVKKPTSAVEARFYEKQAKVDEASQYKKQTKTVGAKVVRYKSAKQPQVEPREEYERAVALQQNRLIEELELSRMKREASLQKQIVANHESLLRKVKKEQRSREDKIKQMEKQLEKSRPAKFKQSDSLNYKGRRQETKVVPRT